MLTEIKGLPIQTDGAIKGVVDERNHGAKLMATFFDVNATVNCDICSVAATTIRTLFTCCDANEEADAAHHAQYAAMSEGFTHDESHHIWLCTHCADRRPSGMDCSLCGAESEEGTEGWDLGKHDPGVVVDICPLCLDDKPWGRTWLTDVAPSLSGLFQMVDATGIEFPFDVTELTDGFISGTFDSFEDFMSFAIDQTQQTYREAHDASSGAADDLDPDDFA